MHYCAGLRGLASLALLEAEVADLAQLVAEHPDLERMVPLEVHVLKQYDAIRAAAPEGFRH